MSDRKLLFSPLWDLADTSYRYAVYGDPINSPKYLITSGSSTTVSELSSTDDTFKGFGTGDLIAVNDDGTWTTRVVTNAGSIPDSVTVGSAVNWQNGTAGRAFSYQRWNNGTTSADGWFRVAEYNAKSVSVSWTTKNATSMDVIIQGRIGGSAAVTIATKNYTVVSSATFGTADVFNIVEQYDDIRVGAQINTDAGVNNVDIRFIGESYGR